MRNAILKVLLPLLLLTALASCASLPARSDSTEGIVAVPITYENTTGVEDTRSIMLYFSGGYGPISMRAASPVLYLTGIRKPGIVLTKIILKWENGFRGDDMVQSVRIPIPYQPGTVTILPMGARYKQFGYHEDLYSFKTQFSMEPVSEALKSKTWSLIRKEPNFASWSGS